MITGIGAGMLYNVANYIEIESDPIHAEYQKFKDNPTPLGFKLFFDQYNPYSGIDPLFGFDKVKKDHANWQDAIREGKASEVEKWKTTFLGYANRTYNNFMNRPMVGASGAIYGLLMALALIFPNLEIMLIIPPIPVKVKWLVLFLGASELYAEFNRAPDDSVAHLAHLGGMLVAFLLIRIWKSDGNNFY